MVASFMVPVTVDMVVDKLDHVSYCDDLNGLGDGKANNGIVKEPELNLLDNVKLTGLSRRHLSRSRSLCCSVLCSLLFSG